MAQSTSSHGSPSPSHSLHAADIPDTDVPIETLLSYLVAAKRSLSSIRLVHRATTILSDARATIETSAALVARTKFLRKSLLAQLENVRGIQYHVESAVQAVKVEIQTVLDDLEQVDKILAEHVDILQTTQVEDGFRAADQAASTTLQDLVQKSTLYDFVDDRPVEDLKSNIQAAIDEVEVAENKMDDLMRSLEEDVQTINTTLIEERTATSSATSSTLRAPNITQMLHMLESHAHEMAVCLESLVKHFDLCVMATKHTEGACALAAKTVNAADLPEGGIDVLYDTPLDPLTDQERIEMLTVLTNDAAEVDEVVMEINDRNAEMESLLDTLLQWRKNKLKSYAEVESAFKLLESLLTRLPLAVSETTNLANQWDVSRTQILEGQTALSDLSSVYARFLDAYDGLIIEVARRRTVKKQVTKIINEVQRRLDELYHDDVNERDVFRSEQGDFLPSDIWAGLGDAPARWEMRRVEGEESVPELPRSRVEEALRRLKSGGRVG